MLSPAVAALQMLEILGAWRILCPWSLLIRFVLVGESRYRSVGVLSSRRDAEDIEVTGRIDTFDPCFSMCKNGTKSRPTTANMTEQRKARSYGSVTCTLPFSVPATDPKTPAVIPNPTAIESRIAV